MVRQLVWIALLSFVLAGGSAQAQTRRSQPAAADLVKLELVADREAVSPGSPLTLAARFQIAPGWHIYWENPGEAGLATEVSFVAPAGFQVGAVRFPGPNRFQSPGESAASFGYEGTAMLSSPVKVPAGAASTGPIRFTAQASWLACRDVCIRGQGSASLELPVAARAKRAHASLFDRHEADLPRRFAALGASSRWEREGGGARLVIAVKRAERIEYFPPAGEDLQLLRQATAVEKGTTELRLEYKAGFQPARARGVLAVTQGAERRYYALDLEERR